MNIIEHERNKLSLLEKKRDELRFWNRGKWGSSYKTKTTWRYRESSGSYNTDGWNHTNLR